MSTAVGINLKPPNPTTVELSMLLFLLYFFHIVLIDMVQRLCCTAPIRPTVQSSQLLKALR